MGWCHIFFLITRASFYKWLIIENLINFLYIYFSSFKHSRISIFQKMFRVYHIMFHIKKLELWTCVPKLYSCSLEKQILHELSSTRQTKWHLCNFTVKPIKKIVPLVSFTLILKDFFSNLKVIFILWCIDNH